MNYQTFQTQPDLEALIKCYWTLEVPIEPAPTKQRILPDGCIEMIFILGDDVKRFISDDKYIMQPRAMILGQISEPFFVEPTGFVDTFAVRFYPYGFANFTTTPLKNLTDKETDLRLIFGEKPANDLTFKIIHAANTQERIENVESFLLSKLKEQALVDDILKSVIDTILLTNGSVPINSIFKGNLSKRRQLERKFSRQVGLSPKQLGKVIRLQAVLKMLHNHESESLTRIAYESQYYDQAHFIKDFKEFTGVTPKDFYKNGELALSSLIYTSN
jgi:hypothetical protein